MWGYACLENEVFQFFMPEFVFLTLFSFFKQWILQNKLV